MEHKKIYALLVACLLSIIGLPFSVADMGWLLAIGLMFVEVPIIYFIYLHFVFKSEDKFYGKHADTDERLRYCQMYAASVALMVLVGVFTLFVYFDQFWSINLSAIYFALGSIVLAFVSFTITFQLKYRWG